MQCYCVIMQLQVNIGLTNGAFILNLLEFFISK